MNKETVRTKRARIVIPILIVIVIIGIWIFKNTARQVPAGDADNPDFALHVTEQIDLDRLKSYGLPILIDFGSDSCAPCREMAPVLVKLNTELRGKAIIKYVDVVKYRDVAQEYPVYLIPTQIFFDSRGYPFDPFDPQKMRMIMYSLKTTGEHVLTAHEGGMTEDMILEVLREMGMKNDQ